MGEFRFHIPDDWNLDAYHANSIHVVGLDGIPWPCRIATSQPVDPDPRKILVISRNNENSGKVFFHYPFEDRGEMLVCTGTLPVRDTPYELLTEVARGTTNRLRNQLSIWEEGGLQISPGVSEKVLEATQHLSRAILSAESDTREEHARQSIEIAMTAIIELSNDFGEQISKFRREHEQLQNLWMAGRAETREQFDWCLQNEDLDLVQYRIPPADTGDHWVNEVVGLESPKPAIVGPWLDASIGGMPSRLVELDDFPVRRNQLVSEIREDLLRLPKATSILHVVGGINGIGHRHLSHPQQLQLTVDLLRQVEESRVEIPTVVSFDFPWAERLAGAVGGVHPLQIADSLLRQGLEISMLGLEINLDYWPNGSAIRDPLQWIDLVDIWAQLGLPLILFLRAPFGPAANEPTQIDRHINKITSNLTDQNRIDFLKVVLPMMVARPAVYGFVWQQINDSDDPRYPRGGIKDETGALKPESANLLSGIRNSIRG